jgi:hypothetical protein
MGHAPERDALADVQIAREQTFMALVAVNFAFSLLLHEVFELGGQSFVPFLVVGFVTQHYTAV